MAQFKNMYKVELNNGIAPVVSLKQIYYADVEANRIGAIVTMNGQPFPLSGTCTGSAILADGSTVPMAGVIDGNQAYIDLDSSCYSVEGQIKIFVKITTGGVTTTLLAAVGTVQLTETDTVIDPGTIIPSVSALITAIEDAVESIPADYTALLETIAPLYANLAFPVKAGQWCWYSGVLYEANQDISTSENWTAAHWKTTTVGGAVSDLKSATGELKINESVFKKLGDNFVWDIVNDSQEAYSREVNQGSSLAEIVAIGGKTNVSGNSLESVSVTSVEYGGHTFDIPAAVIALTGYGRSVTNRYNTIERTENGWVYVQRVGSVDLGARNWTLSSGLFIADISGAYQETNSGFNSIVKGICPLYTWYTGSGVYYANIKDKEFLFAKNGLSNSNKIYVKDTSYESASDFKTAMNNVYMYYWLNTPIVTDITDLMGGNIPLSFIPNDNDEIILHNTENLSAFATVVYTSKNQTSIGIENNFAPIIQGDQFTVLNKYLTSDGRLSTDNDFCATDFIRVRKNDTIEYRYSSDNSKTNNVCIYDDEKNFIECISKYTSGNSVINGSYTVPFDGYIRACTLQGYKLASYLRYAGIAASITDRMALAENTSELSILFIGNSMIVDSIIQLPPLLKEMAPGVKFNIYIWYNGGYDLKGQYTDYFLTGTPCQLFMHNDGTTWFSWSNAYNIDTILDRFDFDIVCPMEYFNVMYNSGQGSYTDTDLNAFKNIVEYIRGGSRKPFKVVTLWHTPLPQSSNVDGLFAFQKAALTRIMNETVCESVIPCGVATYNARSTDLDELGVYGHLSIDGTHIQEGLPCMLLSYVAAMWVFDQLGIPRSVNNSKVRLTSSNYMDLYPQPGKASAVIAGTEEQWALAQTVSVMAYKEGMKEF